jgi:integrase
MTAVNTCPQLRVNKKNPGNGIIEAYGRREGREWTKSLDTTDWGIANQKLQPLIQKWKLGATIGAEFTFGMGAARLLAHYEEADKATYRNLLLTWNRIKHFWHDKSVTGTSGAVFTDYCDRLLAGKIARQFVYKRRKHVNGRLKPGSVRNIQTFLKRVRNFAVERGNVHAFELPHWPKKIGRGKAKNIHHTAAQMATVFQRAAMLRLRGTPPTPLLLLIALGYCTGARYRDMLNLKVTDIEADLSRINYHRMRIGTDGVDKRPANKQAGNPKINADLRPLLVEAIAEAKRRGTPYLLAAEKRTKAGDVTYEVSGLQAQASDLFRGLADEGVIPKGSTIHTMRHTYITLALAAGVPVATVARDVGDTPETIYRVYVHADKDDSASSAISLYNGASPLRVIQGGV